MKIAVLYQKLPAPQVDGIIKPMKLGGYGDSGADVAYSLKKQKFEVITPVDSPNVKADLDWVFPDTADGIQQALDLGADTIWLNTVLYRQHPIQKFIEAGIYVVGQSPESVEFFDDKVKTNTFLKQHGLNIPQHRIIKSGDLENLKVEIPFPVVVKPVRGRGSQGVSLVYSIDQLLLSLNEMFGSADFGDMVYIEEFLPGEEITISIMPPGNYEIEDRKVEKKIYWALPPVKRFNHKDGIAPYNGVVAVVENSVVVSDDELSSATLQLACKMCEAAARFIDAKSVIRIDCRADNAGNYFLFDLNMKPNMTGTARPHRSNQDSLTAIAARAIGWDFNDLLANLVEQRWHLAF